MLSTVDTLVIICHSFENIDFDSVLKICVSVFHRSISNKFASCVVYNIIQNARISDCLKYLSQVLKILPNTLCLDYYYMHHKLLLSTFHQSYHFVTAEEQYKRFPYAIRIVALVWHDLLYNTFHKINTVLGNYISIKHMYSWNRVLEFLWHGVYNRVLFLLLNPTRHNNIA